MTFNFFSRKIHNQRRLLIMNIC